jgi:hypothetical protein
LVWISEPRWRQRRRSWRRDLAKADGRVSDGGRSRTMSSCVCPFICLVVWRLEHRLYGCQDGRFPVSASCVTISKPNPFSSIDIGFNPGIRTWKKSLIWMRSMSRSHWWYLFHEEVKSWDSTTAGLEFDNFNPWLKSGIFKCIS